MVFVDLSGKRTGHTNNHNGTKPVVCKCSTLWRADQYQLLFYCMEIQSGYSMMPDSRKFKEKAGGYDDERGG